jgi:hypothetical protein
VLPTICVTATTNLVAALDFKAGTVFGQFHRSHGELEFRQFLETILHQVPDSRSI